MSEPITSNITAHKIGKDFPLIVLINKIFFQIEDNCKPFMLFYISKAIVEFALSNWVTTGFNFIG